MIPNETRLKNEHKHKKAAALRMNSQGDSFFFIKLYFRE